jgi:hypothetical protein
MERLRIPLYFERRKTGEHALLYHNFEKTHCAAEIRTNAEKKCRSTHCQRNIKPTARDFEKTGTGRKPFIRAELTHAISVAMLNRQIAVPFKR